MKPLPPSVLVMDWTCLFYFAIAWYTGGDLFRRLCYVELLSPLSIDMQSNYGLLPCRAGGDLSYWLLLPMHIVQPVVLLNYGHILTLVCCFSPSIVVLFY